MHHFIVITHTKNSVVSIILINSYMPKVIIYTRDLCGYCYAAMHEFEKQGWDYKEYNTSISLEIKEQMQRKAPEATTLPQIWIDEKHIGGYDDLMRFLK